MEPLTLFLRGLPDDRLVRLGRTESGKVFPVIPGNSRLDLYCQVPEDQRRHLEVDGPIATEGFAGPTPNAIVNCISDPETMGNSMAGAKDVVATYQKENPAIIVVNHPDSVQRLRRDTIYQLFHKLPGIVVPRTVRVKPRRVDDVIDHLERFGLRFPFLMRPTRSGHGVSLVHVEGLQDRDLLEQFPYDGREFFLTNFRDTKGSSGIYRKLRLMVIRGQLFPRHLIISDRWRIGENSRRHLMNDRVDLRESERDLLNEFDKQLSPQTREAIEKIHQLLALDFFVIDCAPAMDGRIFVFDIHASVAESEVVDDAENSHLEPFSERIRAACQDLVRNPALPTDNFWAGFANS